VGYDEAKARAKTLHIHDTIAEIIDRSEKLKAPTYKVADMLVEERLAAATRKR
jgi:leucine dehydrogenase